MRFHLHQGTCERAICSCRALSAILLQAGVGRQISLLDVDNAVLWFNHKRMLPDSKLSDYVGKNEKTKVVPSMQISQGCMGEPDVVCLLELVY